ncbi:MULTISPECIES: acyl carrier protein [Apilactobacillus]|uniref:Acyl carrier protein n=2 Tax=Apilactobacillus TaxID=2767877 RepID=A0A2S2JKN7_9LACO|nr:MULTISPECIES: acyl carrier protein [Apilactobacillus]TPR14780.1 acyl carrier protein [Apilactobacillus timberlakei]TPR15747.1 acyl carrier protein [Apilactobacillus timberlakei]TPR16108.1 acyl carrier protein [Apilactobacillus timberlakei]TPR18200.1 acyl carrier protein [Apilactobacillus timberlakei]TPR18855.1 acyl carrier protein [Apilactobacillus timberlakei]
MADKNAIFDKVKEIVVDQSDVNADDIKMETKFQDELDLDSLDLFEIIDALEDEYDIEIDTDNDITTVQQLVDYVAKQVEDK